MSQPNERVAATPRPDGHVADLVDDYLHKLLDPDRAAVVERHCESCPGCKAALDDARRRWAALRAVPPAEAAEQLVHTTMQKIDAHRQARKRRWRRFLWAAGTALAASVVVLAWLHIATANLAATPYDLVVLGQRDLLASTDNSLRVLLRDPKTLAPLANIPVTLQLVDRAHNQTADLGGFTTDAHGDGQPRFTLPDWPDAAYELRVVAQTPGAPETADLSVTLKRASKVMLSTDKPVYQPGQVIHARALALRRPDLHPVAADTAAFSVIDSKGNVVFKLLDKTSRYGIAAADCPLDTEILEGAYTVVGKVGGVESRVSVEVKKYVLPKFKLAVTPDKPFYKESDTVKLTVQADYFFGKPVAGAEVKVDAKYETTGGVAGTLEGRTDAKGTASFDFVLQPPQMLGQKEPPSELSHVRLQASVTDTAGQKQTAFAERVVSAWPARVDILPEAGELVAGVSNRIYVLVTRLDSRPAGRAAVTLTAQSPGQSAFGTADADQSGAAVFEFPWGAGQGTLEAVVKDEAGAEIARRRVVTAGASSGADFLVRTDRAIYRGGATMKLTALGGGGPVFVDLIREGRTLLTETIEMANGRGEAAVDLPPELAGTVQVVGYRVDAKGWPARKTRVVYVQPADEVHIAATLDPGRNTYKPGERTTLRLKLTGKDGKPCPGAVSLSGVDEAVFSVLPQRPGTEEAFYTLEQELMQPVNKIHPWSPGDAGSERYQEALFAAASRSDAAPQGSAPPLIKQVAPLIDEIVPVQPELTTHSLVAQTYQAKEQRTEDLRATRLIWIKWGWVWLVIGVIAAALLGFWLFGQTSVLVKSLVTGYVVVPFLLFALAAALVDQGFSVGAKFPAAMSPMRIDREEEVADIAAAGMVAPDADLSKVDVGADPGLHEPGGAPKPPVREMFPETLLWRPEIITDDDGAASLSLDLADSITTWRLSASAVTGDGRLGAAALPVKVFQDFFVDLNLPVALTRGDEIAVPVVVYNYLDKPQTVTLSLTDADWFKRLDGVEQRLELAPNEVRSVRYRLRVEKVGTYSLTVEAHGAIDSDAVKRSIEVVPDGRVVEQVVNGTLEKPASVEMVLPEGRIPGSEKAFVKIYPSSFSQLVEGLDNIFQMPYGCFEQTSSTTYPNILALDYLKRTGKSAPAVEAKARGYIRLGYQRLLSFELAGGGFDWFGNPPANRALTAYGLMEFADMARVQDVDPVLIERTRRWLLSQRRPDGSWDPEDRKMHEDAVGGQTPDDARLAETAYIAWAVYGDPAASADSAATLAYLKRRGPETIKDPHTLALVCNALLAADEHNPDAGPYLDRLETMKRTSDDGKFAWWAQAPGLRTTFYGAGRGGEIETTALAALALLRAGGYGETAREALTWLTSQKDPHGTWYSTQATVLALKALLAGTGKALNGDGERVVEVRLNGDVVRTVRIPAELSDVLKQVDISSLLKPGKQTLTMTEANGAAVGFAASFRYNMPDANPTARKDSLSVDLKYDRTEVAVGEQIAATVNVTSGKEAAPMVMVELPVPAGFAASAEDFAALVGPGKKVAKYQMRPGKVLLYLTSLDAGESLKATYHLRALTPAKVTAAGARAYEYYDPDKQGISPATRLTVNARE